MTTLALYWYPNGGERFLLANGEENRWLLAHLTGGTAAMGEEDLPRIRALAKAHGWEIEIYEHD